MQQNDALDARITAQPGERAQGHSRSGGMRQDHDRRGWSGRSDLVQAIGQAFLGGIVDQLAVEVQRKKRLWRAPAEGFEMCCYAAVAQSLLQLVVPRTI